MWKRAEIQCGFRPFFLYLLDHQPNKTVGFHKGIGVGHDNGVNHSTIDGFLIPSREQALLVDFLCNLFRLHPMVRGCQDKDNGFFDFHMTIGYSSGLYSG